MDDNYFGSFHSLLPASRFFKLRLENPWLPNPDVMEINKKKQKKQDY